jgi:hypothetical protein
MKIRGKQNAHTPIKLLSQYNRREFETGLADVGQTRPTPHALKKGQSGENKDVLRFLRIWRG